MLVSGNDLAFGGKFNAQFAFVTLLADNEIRCSSELEYRYNASPAFVNVNEEIPLEKKINKDNNFRRKDSNLKD